MFILDFECKRNSSDGFILGLTFRPKPAMIGRVVGGQIVQKDNWPDKAQTEMSALYPAFFVRRRNVSWIF